MLERYTWMVDVENNIVDFISQSYHKTEIRSIDFTKFFEIYILGLKRKVDDYKYSMSGNPAA